jgi:hypothetical protein
MAQKIFSRNFSVSVTSPTKMRFDVSPNEFFVTQPQVQIPLWAGPTTCVAVTPVQEFISELGFEAYTAIEIEFASGQMGISGSLLVVGE